MEMEAYWITAFFPIWQCDLEQVVSYKINWCTGREKYLMNLEMSYVRGRIFYRKVVAYATPGYSTSIDLGIIDI